MRLIAIDIQGFSIPEFIAKEITFIRGLGEENFGHYLLKPPVAFSKLSERDKHGVIYLERNHHGIRYSSGDLPYEEVPDLIRYITRDVDTIIVKGQQKKEFLQDLVQDVRIIDIGNENYDVKQSGRVGSTRCVPHRCTNHFLRRCVCSLHNCMILYNYVLNLLPQ